MNREDLTTKGAGLVNPQVHSPGPARGAEPGDPGTRPGDNPGPGIMPPVPGTPHPGDPPAERPIPMPPSTPQPSPTQPPATPGNPPSMNA
jgi:hypothetical protein